MNDLEKIQYVNVLLLDELDRICREAEIPYFLYAGTLIGAVREHDFIEWDDDADVGFLREDYERFLTAAAESLGGAFELVLPEQTGGFYDMIAKLTFKESRLHSHRDEDDYYRNTCSRISLDLYVIDRTCRSRIGFAFQCFQLKMLYGMMMDKRYRIEWRGYSPLEWLQVRVLTLLGKPFRLPVLMCWYGRVSQRYRKSSSPYAFASNSVLQMLGVRFERAWFEETEPVVFRGSRYDMPKGYDRILTERYGAYMTPRKERFTVAHAARNEVEVWIEGEPLR